MNEETKLNPEQQKAVLQTEGAVLVLAGAGSGKTRIVTHRIAHLIDEGVFPDEILAVTFTNKAAEEMQQRVRQLLHSKRILGKPVICTFHSLGAKILRESIQALGFQNNFVIYDEEDASKLLKGCLQTLGIQKELAQTKTFKNLISQAKNQLQPIQDLILEDWPSSIQKLFTECYRLYHERLKEANAVDFDDLLCLTVKLFQEHPAILEAYQLRWKYLLVDEYQDTNHAQYLIIRHLSAKNGNLFVVGDPDQSIYSWRGANIRNILDFEKDFAGATVVRLEQNYRSRENILEAANALIAHNQSRYKKNLWSDRGQGEKITIFVGSSEREEAFFVIHEIERLRTFHNVPLKEIAIFYRTNFQSRLFEDFLIKQRLPYIIVGGISFYHRKEIKDLLSFLHMIESDCDFIAFARTINLPKRGIGETTLEKIRMRATETKIPIFALCETMMDVLHLSAKQKEALQSYVALIKQLRAIKAEGPLKRLLIETIRQSGYLDVLKEDKETYDDRKANLDELVSKAAEWEELNQSSSLTSFLEELSLKSTIDDASFSDDKIRLMTLHNGKGLEFQAAFIVGMEEDLFPHANSRDSQHALEEERRLCYVGMTRAKEYLYLSAAQMRFIWGTHRMMHPSRFLREIPREFIHRIK